MKNKFVFNEVAISIILLVLVALFLDPFMILMPESFIKVLVTIFLFLFLFFASFVWREKSKDEREEYHKMLAGRFAYLVGAGILVLGIIVQTSLQHTVDTWLVIALIGMVISKLGGLFYSRLQK